MKKIFLFLGCALLLTSSVSAQNSAKAKALLDEVTAKVNSYQNIAIDFNFEMRNAMGDLQQESKGNVIIAKNNYELNFMGVKKISDGKKIYTISSEDEEVTISNFNANDPESLLPSELLTFYKKGYEYHWDIVQNVKGRKIQYIKLKPTNSKSELKEVLLGIDSQTKNIYNKIDIAKNGTKSILTVNSFKTNQTISKNHFTFTESMYPNYYINKLD
ncbi:LolA family protein [Myroides guanonis]|uniref:Outer membrane lipoprotein-sorting protein n=1 Tax=Myroides guanonis TaxID=1150112 RepID=A0A1I3U4J7_9FLAO|nr:outer membrane lipoprotein carrier protein LolA [Myroides guanonis]SFJ77940.1 Outer membrane lipoprotein-sorting protein [Myroides guanonis]